jgi:hypothetical protein
MKDTIATLFRATLFRAAAGARTAPRAAVAVTLLGFACGLGGCVSAGAGSGLCHGRQRGTVVFERSMARRRRSSIE